MVERATVAASKSPALVRPSQFGPLNLVEWTDISAKPQPRCSEEIENGPAAEIAGRVQRKPVVNGASERRKGGVKRYFELLSHFQIELQCLADLGCAGSAVRTES